MVTSSKPHKPITTILTLQMDPQSQDAFDRLRQEHYPEHLNRIAAHLTLFHSLPDSEEVRRTLAGAAEAVAPFHLDVTGVVSLGRGVAYSLNSAELQALRHRLSTAFRGYLIPQDRQGFRPHVVVQNKVSATEAKGLRARLAGKFVPWRVQAEGLAWWNYLGGPWVSRETFRFRAKVPE